MKKNSQPLRSFILVKQWHIYLLAQICGTVPIERRHNQLLLIKIEIIEGLILIHNIKSDSKTNLIMFFIFLS